jgi:hypothetical protein
MAVLAWQLNHAFSDPGLRMTSKIVVEQLLHDLTAVVTVLSLDGINTARTVTGRPPLLTAHSCHPAPTILASTTILFAMDTFTPVNLTPFVDAGLPINPVSEETETPEDYEKWSTFSYGYCVVA